MEKSPITESLKRLLPYLKPHKRLLILTLFLGVLLAGVDVLTAEFLKRVMDDVFVAKNVSMLKMAPLLIVGLYGVAGVIRFTHMFFLRYLADVIGFDIRRDLQARYMQLSLSFHAKNSSGSLISKTINDVIQVQLGLSTLADVVREPIAALALLGYAVYTNWKLTLITLLAAPLLILASRSLGRSVRKYSNEMQESWEVLMDVLKETLDGIRVIKAFSIEERMKTRFKNITEHLLMLRRKILGREELAGPVFEFLAAVTLAGILYFAGYQVVRGESTAGEFMAFVLALGLLQKPIKKLQEAHVRLQHTVASGRRIFEILDTPVTVKDPADRGVEARPWPSNWGRIEFKNVQFSYDNHNVLKGVNLTVKRGEMVAIVGPSGSGKSTLVNLLPRFYDVTHGAIEIDGVDIRDLRLKDLRSQIGLVTQDVFLFNESIQENVMAGHGAMEDESQRKVQAAIQAAHAAPFVNNLEKRLQTPVGERGSKLSGGERQRISIARAIYKNTPILILDEATSSLDSESEKIVQQALDELMKGRTTFVIAHRLSTVQRADRIIVVADGAIAEAGSHAELMGRNGMYHRLYTTQFGISANI